MTCMKTDMGYICGFAEYRNYICFEHTTYLFEFSRGSGPAWFSVPGDEEIFPEPGGAMDFLWGIFDEMRETGVFE